MTDNLPTEMQAIAIGDAKTPDSLSLEPCTVPAMGDAAVFVQIAPAGVKRGAC